MLIIGRGRSLLGNWRPVSQMPMKETLLQEKWYSPQLAFHYFFFKSTCKIMHHSDHKCNQKTLSYGSLYCYSLPACHECIDHLPRPPWIAPLAKNKSDSDSEYFHHLKFNHLKPHHPYFWSFFLEPSWFVFSPTSFNSHDHRPYHRDSRHESKLSPVPPPY